MNQFLGSIVLLPAEIILNRILSQDSHISRQLRPFTGKSIEIRSTMPSVVITLSFYQDRIKLGSLNDEFRGFKPDACVSGDADELFSMLLGDEQKPLTNTGIAITGDALLVQDLFVSLRELDMDWQDYLAPVLGDILTNEMGQFNRQAQGWSNSARNNLRRNLDDYLKEEARIVPHRQQVAQFSDQLDQLKLAIDRAEAGLGSIQKRLDKSLKNQHLFE